MTATDVYICQQRTYVRKEEWLIANHGTSMRKFWRGFSRLQVQLSNIRISPLD